MGLYAYEQCAHPQAVLFGGWGGGGGNSLGGLYHTLIQIEGVGGVGWNSLGGHTT